MQRWPVVILGVLAVGVGGPSAVAGGGETSPDDLSGALCERYGPQTPRDIDQFAGENRVIFSPAPPYEVMNLCNLHFHRQAEHRAKDFPIPAVDPDGTTEGFRCLATPTLTAEETHVPAEDLCHGLRPGDTVEVHWVYSSCDVGPGKGLAACVSPACSNPNLRVEAQVFLLVDDRRALDFLVFDYGGTSPRGYHQAKSLPTGTGTPVNFAGSTTGPTFDDRNCSPFQVSWSVRPRCAKLDIASLGRWCRRNDFDENHAHGVRKLVQPLPLLAPIPE